MLGMPGMPPALHPSTRLMDPKPPRKRQRSLSSPSPPRPMIIDDFPARAHPGTILSTGPEGTTLADTKYGPQTANATNDEESDVKRRRLPPLVSTAEYNDRIQWRSAYLYKKAEGIDTFNYSTLTGVEPGVPSDPNAPTPDCTAVPDGAIMYAPVRPPARNDGTASYPATPNNKENVEPTRNVPPWRNPEYIGGLLMPSPPIVEPPRTKPAGNPLFQDQPPQGYYSLDDPPPQWTATQAKLATQPSPGHPLRRRIKSPASEAGNRLFRTDHYNNIDKYPELNPNTAAPFAEVAKTRALFAQELIPTSIIPTMPKPENLFLPTTAMAVRSVHARPPLEEESFMPMPSDGGPTIHTDSAWGRFRGLPQARAEYILSLPKDKTIIFNVWGSRGDVSTIYDDARRIITAFLCGATSFTLIPPEGEWGKKVAPQALNAPSLWCATDLTAAQATALADRHCLGKPELTLFCYRPVLENPQFLLRAGNFISKDPDLIRETLQSAFLEPSMRARITGLLKQNPNYSGLDADQAFYKFLMTIEMDFKEVRMGNPPREETVVSIYCDPPTNNPDRWLQWAREFRAMHLQHPRFLNSATVLPPIRCSGCHGVDHFIDQCAWPEMSDWRAPLPNVPSASSATSWNPFQRFGPSTPHASSSSSNNRNDNNRKGGFGFGFSSGMGFGSGGGGGNGRSTPNNANNNAGRGHGFGSGFGRNPGT